MDEDAIRERTLSEKVDLLIAQQAALQIRVELLERSARLDVPE